ncbi:Ig-like domain-containing protein [Chloroflexi bacterium TSY]|nr:Ig-like domain-containing protein [Chloroflexi bacterium TSY]
MTGLIFSFSSKTDPVNIDSSPTTFNSSFENSHPSQFETPPIFIGSIPEAGSWWMGDGVTFIFDQPLSGDSSQALQISPQLDGTTEVQNNTITFTPATRPRPDVHYTFFLDQRVTSTNGAALNAPVSIFLSMATPLKVTSIQPRNHAQDVDVDVPIVITFNRPVVALTGLAEQAKLPAPLSIEPSVQGQGEWLNTSTYRFHPTSGWVGGTAYTVIVDNVVDSQGTSLQTPITTQFRTALPVVTGFSPDDAVLKPESTLQVSFNQPMDPQSTEDAYVLVNLTGEEGGLVEGQFGWNATQTTLTFTPTRWLEFGATYALEIGIEARSANGLAQLRQPYYHTVDVTPYPAIQTVTPESNSIDINPERNVVIKFNTPISPTLLMQNLDVTPLLTTTQVYSYYSAYSREVTLSWYKEPQTTYTVTIGGAVADHYGNRLGSDREFSFTTGDYSPFVRSNLGQFTHFNGYTKTHISVLYRNVESVRAGLFRLPESELFKLTGENQYQVWEDYQIPNRAANRVWQRNYAAGVEHNVTGQQVISLTNEVGDILAAGIYMLELQTPVLEQDQTEESTNESVSNATTPLSIQSWRPAYKLLLLGNQNLLLKKSSQGESVVWLTDLISGKPVPGQAVRFYANGELRAQAVTDTDGLAKANLNLLRDELWQPILAISGEPGTARFGAVSSQWNEGIGPWEFDISGGGQPNHYLSHFYTDRPIYRPGQTVHWKGIVRAIHDDGYRLPTSDLPIAISIRDDRGNEIARQDVRPNAHGTVHGAVVLQPEATTGYYFLEAQIGEFDESVYGGVSFQVGAYRKPEFEIDLALGKDEYIAGETISVTAEANYLSGGPLSDAKVTWRLLAEPYEFQWSDGEDGRFFQFTPFDPEQDISNPYLGAFDGGLLMEGSGVTDADGLFQLTLPADLSQTRQSQRWVIDVSIQSSTNQFVSARASVPVHKSSYYAGLRPRHYVTSVGNESTIDLVAVSPQGDPLSNRTLEIVVVKFEWNSVYEIAPDGQYRWRASVERTPVLTDSVSTNQAGMASFDWVPTSPGQYEFKVTGLDQNLENGQTSSTSVAYTYVSSQDDQFVAWRRDNNDRIQLVADKEEYRPGDIAKILVPSPFLGPVKALVTLERNGILDTQVMTLDGNSETLTVPITAEHIPNIYVSVMLVKGIDQTNPIPAMRLGYVQLPVDVSERELTVDIVSSVGETRPGEPISYTLSILDRDENTVSGAEVSIALVDKAIFSLASDFRRSLLDAFYNEQPLGVSTSALLVINRDRLSQQLTEGTKGGGGGGGAGAIEVRDEFPDSAYWRADLVTDEHGKITFAVDLPDNLTTWRLVVRAVTDETLVGEAEHDIIATKELQIRPKVPRFFTAGDQATIGAVVVNATDQVAAGGQVAIDVEGATFVNERTTAQLATLGFDLEAGEQVRLDTPIVVGAETDHVTITMTAEAFLRDDIVSAGLSPIRDAVRLTIPVRRYETPAVVASAGQVDGIELFEALRIPDEATNNGSYQIRLEPSLAAGMAEGFDYLEHYPYECNEQTVSRFLPNLFTLRALQTLGLQATLGGQDNIEELEESLQTQLRVGVQKLVNRQNPDGGWGYWPGEESTPFVSAYVLWGLLAADFGKESANGTADSEDQTVDLMGYVVPKQTLMLAVEYLERQFRAPSEVIEMGSDAAWQLNEMAFIHYVLAMMGEGDPGRASTLFDEREKLAIYGQAFLAMALDRINQEMSPDNEQRTDERVEQLLDAIFAKVNLTASSAFWSEESTDYRTLNTNTRTTAIALTAFSRLAPEEPLLPMVVRWLMETRRAGRWASTQENVWSLIALTEWMVASGELEGDYNWNVTVNSQRLDNGEVNRANLQSSTDLTVAIAKLLRDEANIIQIERSNPSGQLYYTTHLRTYQDAQDVAPIDRGILIDSKFTRQASVGEAIQVGELVSITVSVIAPTDLHHVLVEAPIPAGTEPIDARLNTESALFVEPQVNEVTPRATRGDWWSNWLPTHIDIRDDKVTFFATQLSAGTYEYTFQVRATIPGTYRILPAHAEMMYFPEVWGRSAGDTIVIEE